MSEGRGKKDRKTGRGEGPTGSEGSSRDRVQEGLDALSGMKNQLGKALDEARARGDLDPERARELAREAGKRVRGVAGEAGRRIRETDREDLEEAISDLKERMSRVEDALRDRWAGGKDREGARKEEEDE